MIWRDEKKFWALLVFGLSGILGMIIFTLQMNDPLFPMLSGLFGIATLIISLNDKNPIPPQKEDTIIKLDRKKTILSIIAGNVSGFIVSTFPGLSGSIAAMLSMQVVRDLKDHGFMILMGVIGTSSFVLSLVALYTIDKARNGAVIVVSKLIAIDTATVLIFLCASLISGGIAAIITMRVGKLFGRMMGKINYQLLVMGIIFFVTGMVIVLCSWKGLLVLITATAIGLIPGIIKVQRTHAMACLIVPIILYLI
jgi:putative membrane protein